MKQLKKKLNPDHWESDAFLQNVSFFFFYVHTQTIKTIEKKKLGPNETREKRSKKFLLFMCVMIH